MANPEHLKILKRGVEQWNRWRKENPDITPDLSMVNLCGEMFIGADLRWADLSEADLSQANLSEADLSEADLRWADLGGADLGG
jgi:uncharacterized protein YjbI with pentapeptide repeats